MIKEINASRNKYFSAHEKVFYFEDKKVGLSGYVAWHNTRLGPATGGTRFFVYKNKKEALSDVLKLSKTMTYKAAFAGVPFGGGKAVICASSKSKNKKLLTSYAKIISSFNGQYTTGTDVGVTDEDTKFMSSITPFILTGSHGHTTTSLMGARGVYEATLAAFKELYPNKKLKDMTISIKGLGKIGAELTRLLYKDGANIYVSDIDELILKKIKKAFPKIKVADHKNAHKLKVDIYSPCAMGGEFTVQMIKELNCKIVCGGANNQLSEDKNSILLHRRGIYWIPDYVANAGGLIQIVDELDGGYSRNRVKKRILNIGKSVRLLIRESKRSGETLLVIANKLVEKKLSKYEK